jgi:hypothetical protein
MRFGGGDANGVLFLTTDSPRQVNSLALANRETIRYDGPSFAIQAFRPIWSDDYGTVTDQILASAVKPAVSIVFDSNVASRSGEKTNEGVTTSNSTVLLVGQTTGSQNGPWVTAAGGWFRPVWYTSGSTTQAPQFLTTFVRLGTTYQGSTWRMTTASVTIDTTATTWVQTPTNVNSATGTLAVANGGTGIASFGSGIATFFGTPSSANLASAVTDETGSGALVFGTAPTLTGATVDSGTLTLSGNQSAAAWTTNGIRLKGISGTLTDTTSSGTVAAAYTNKLGGNTIAASSATTFTNYMSGYFSEPVAGTNVTLTNKWALGADSLYVGTSNPFSITSAGAVTAAGLLTATGNVKTAIVYPASDSTTALKIAKADGTTAVGTWDTTNSRLGINVTPAATLDVLGANTVDALKVSVTGQNPYVASFWNTGYSSSNALFHYFGYNSGHFRMGSQGAKSVGIFTSDAISAPGIVLLSNNDVAIGGSAGSSGDTVGTPTLTAYHSGGVFIGTTPSDPGAGNLTVSGTGAASSSALKLTGTPFAGTGTTSFPLVYLNDSSATASTTLRTAGTYLGVNGHGTARLLELMLDGTSKLSVDSTGDLVSAASLQGTDLIAGSGNAIRFSSRNRIESPSNGVFLLTNTTSAGLTRVDFGLTTNSGSAIGFDAVNGFTLQSAAGTATWNDGSTANSGTVANRYLFGIAAPTLTSTGTSVTEHRSFNRLHRWRSDSFDQHHDWNGLRAERR